MKNLLLILIGMVFFISCKNEKNQDEDVAGDGINVVDNKIVNKDRVEMGDSIVIIISETKNKNDSLSNLHIQSENASNNFDHKIDEIGNVNKIFTQDIDSNGLKELYILTKPAYSGLYGKLLVFAVDKERSIRQVLVKEIGEETTKDTQAKVLYDANDSFYIDTGGLVRRINTYEMDDTLMKRKPAGFQSIIFQLDKSSDPWILKISSNSVSIF